MKIEQVSTGYKIFQESDHALPASRSSAQPTKLQITLWFVIVLLLVTASLSNFLVTQVGARFDESRYLILARSLVFTDRYGMMNAPGEPTPERYPFGYPLLISPIVRLFPDQLDAPKVLSLVATIINISLLFWGWSWFFQGRSFWWALAISGLYALSPVTVDFSRRIMSEPVFMTFSLLAILLAEEFVRSQPNRWFVPGLSLALTFVVFTRTIGIVLLACVFFFLLLRLGRAAWKEIFKILLLMGLWVGLVVALTPVRMGDLLPVGYLKNDKNARPFTTIIYGDSPAIPEGSETNPQSSQQLTNPRPAHRVSTIGSLFVTAGRHLTGDDLREITLPFGTGVLRQALDRSVHNSSVILAIYDNIITALVFFGFILLFFRERLTLFALSGILYLVAIFFWNWAHPRLLLPIQPQIQLAWLIALETIFYWAFRLIPRKNSLIGSPPIVLPVFTVLVMLASAVNSFRVQDSRLYTGDLPTRSEWLRAHTQTSDIIMTESPEVDYLYSERKTAPYPVQLSSAKELVDYLAENKIGYVLVASHLGWVEGYIPYYSDRTKDLLPLLDELRLEDQVELVNTSEANLVRIYQIKQDALTISSDE